MDGWMDGWMDGEKDGWTDGTMGGWAEEFASKPEQPGLYISSSRDFLAQFVQKLRI